MPIIKKKGNPRLERFNHYLFGFLVIVKGIEKSEHFSEHPFICLSLFIIGGFILYANFRHHFFEKHFRDFHVILFLSEGLVLAGVSYYYFSEGRKGLPYAYLLAAVLYFVAAVIKYRKKSAAEMTGTKEAEVISTEEESAGCRRNGSINSSALRTDNFLSKRHQC